jgi:hypothetical protein
VSRLSLYGRQWVVFDAQSKQHRQWFAEFQSRKSWSNCPVRFIIDDENGDLLTMIQRRLIEYYTDQEFGKKRKTKSVQRTLTLVKD